MRIEWAELTTMMSRLRRGFLFSLIALLGSLPLEALPANQLPPAPLPDLQDFLRQVRERLHSDEFLLEQYTFTERHTERHLDSRGRTKRVTSEVFEVYPSPEPGHTYRRLVERDGKPLDAKELASEDQKQEERTALESTRAAQLKRLEKRAEARSREAHVVGELFQIYDIAIAGREDLDGRPTILLTFRPRAGVEPTTKAGKILMKFSGRAWIDEEDRQLVRVEGDLLEDLSFGLGFLAKLKKGAHAELLRRKVNDEIWLPAEARFVGSARVLLVKSMHLDALSEYSDYKKFSVETEAKTSVPDLQNR